MGDRKGVGTMGKSGLDNAQPNGPCSGAQVSPSGLWAPRTVGQFQLEPTLIVTITKAVTAWKVINKSNYPLETGTREGISEKRFP